jgi:HAE1 family hydrophobic/amphiphilic exporter-1
VVKSDADSDAILRIAVTSSRRTADELTTLVRDLAEARLLSAPGVADLQIFGDRELAFRVDVNLMQLAARGLTLADLRACWAMPPLMRRRARSVQTGRACRSAPPPPSAPPNSSRR